MNQWLCLSLKATSIYQKIYASQTYCEVCEFSSNCDIFFDFTMWAWPVIPLYTHVSHNVIAIIPYYKQLCYFPRISIGRGEARVLRNGCYRDSRQVEDGGDRAGNPNGATRRHRAKLPRRPDRLLLERLRCLDEWPERGAIYMGRSGAGIGKELHQRTLTGSASCWEPLHWQRYSTVSQLH